MQNDLTHRLSEGMSAFSRANMNRKTKLPIRSSEMGALVFITLNAGETGVRAVELSEYFGIRKASVSSIILTLENQGYIKRTTSEKDKRSSPLFPTEKGSQLVSKAIDEYYRFSSKLIAKIGTERCEEFLRTLDIATKIIQGGDEEK